jgi:hypothetical protein
VAVVVALAVFGSVAGAGTPATAGAAALAFPCNNITPTERYASTVAIAEERTPMGSSDGTDNVGTMAQNMEISYQWDYTSTVTTSVGGSAEAGEVFKATVEATRAQSMSIRYQRTVAQKTVVPPMTSIRFQPMVTRKWVVYYSLTFLEKSFFLGWWCTPVHKLSLRSAYIPISATTCTWNYAVNGPRIENCPNTGGSGGGGGGGGTPPPGGTPLPPPGPQPVTSVHGLADGTLMKTTDTGRIYKMAGGAPIWQATCAQDICVTNPRPTTQAVINAGPATPRNGSTVIDQRGRTHLFVGGAPLWQDSCAAPVTCGNPVKVSDWSVDARDHMNQRPADGNLVQARSGSTDLPVSVTVGGALVPFASPQEVVDAGYGTDWASRVVAISADSYNGIGWTPADGTLIQGAAGGVSTPVGAVIGGAAIPFANPQEAVDAGYGTDWASKVRGVPARFFNALPPVPRDGTLVQGSVGSTPVAAIVGAARVNFASPQEVVDAGYGTDWATKVHAVPARAFHAMNTRMLDGTRIKDAGSSSQAAIVGGARVAFASMQELTDSGYADRRMWSVPTRTWNELPTRIEDGTRIKDAGSTSQAAIVGGARIAFASLEELTDAGYADNEMFVVPHRVWASLSSTIADGTRIAKAGDTSQAAVVGGAKVPFVSMEELEGSGYLARPAQSVPPRVWDALSDRIADGTRLKDAGSTSQAVVVGGAKVPFASEQEVTDTGYGTRPMQTVPRRVWDALPAVPKDRTLIRGTSGGQATAVAQSVGGAAMRFASAQEITEAGFGADWATRIQTIPTRAFTAMLRAPADGTTVIGTSGVAYRASGGTLEIAGSCPQWSGCSSATPVVAQDTLAEFLEYRPGGNAWVDVTGDGRADYCRRVGEVNQQSSRLACTPSTGTGFAPAIVSGVQDWGYAAGRAWADVDGDDKADYCRVGGDDNQKKARVFCTVSTGTGFGAGPLSGVLDAGEVAGRTWVDMTGDGRADYCRIRGTANFTDAVVSCTPSTGTGFGADITSANMDWGFSAGRAFTDFDGDGRADYCRVSGSANHTAAFVSCTVSTGTGFGATYRSATLDWGAGPDRAWADVNGDGRADYCRRVGTASDSHVSCTLSTGTGFGATIVSGALDWGKVGSRTWVDANGDGRADYCRVVGAVNHTDARMTCTTSTGTGFGTDVSSANTDWGYPVGRAWADVDGDGRADACRRVGDTRVAGRVLCTTSTGGTFSGNLLSEVLDWGHVS